jgi:tellurite resistance protein
MFLNKLEENEKVAFLTLAYHIARSDGDFSENEQNIIATYCMEMQIQDINYNKDNFDLNSVLLEFRSKEHQKILLIEIMALIYSDGLHDEEQKILDQICDQFVISNTLSAVYAEWSKSILAIVTQGKELIKL